ncbi:MAG: hypothetical protein ACK2T0_12025, partial [Anaerolineales bacterium]
AISMSASRKTPQNSRAAASGNVALFLSGFHKQQSWSSEKRSSIFTFGYTTEVINHTHSPTEPTLSAG